MDLYTICTNETEKNTLKWTDDVIITSHCNVYFSDLNRA